MRSNYAITTEGTSPPRAGSSSTSSTSGSVTFRTSIPLPARQKRDDRNIQSAIYAYIRARRALGETTISVSDIARGLELPPSEVARAVSALRGRGVKPLK